MNDVFTTLEISPNETEMSLMNKVRDYLTANKEPQFATQIIEQLIPGAKPKIDDPHVLTLTAIDVVRQAYFDHTHQPSLTLAQMKAEEASAQLEELFGVGSVESLLESDQPKKKSKKDTDNAQRPSKMGRAREIVSEMTSAKSADIIARLVSELQLSVVAARTYLYNIRREIKEEV